MVGITLEPVPASSRKMRRPQHRHYILQRPWMIAPFMIAPVLPGETMQNLLLQARAVSDPVANKLIGWWLEYYYFYVPFSALNMGQAGNEITANTTLINMMLDPDADVSALAPGSDHLGLYHTTGSTGVQFLQYCLQAIVHHWFRDQDENYNTATMTADFLGGSAVLPTAKINIESWTNSLIDTTLMPTGGTLPDEDAGGSYEDLARGMYMYEQLMAQGLINMSYADYLRTFGVKPPPEATSGKPELLRYVRDWQYPSNTIDPTSGVARSALSWSITERADKNRLFREPGFIVGVSVARPKVYLSKQKSSMVNYMDTAMSWLPAVLRDEPWTSLKEFGASAGPLDGNTTNGYWVDVRDLLIYGDQFVNFALDSTTTNMVALPTVALQHKYASATDAGNLFIDTDGPLYTVRQDGVTSLHILGTQQDHTPVGISKPVY